ncbi:MAG TPA: hypothetical protein VJ201_05745, partial [Candidatus Babeliales bacterium]|nr:hypothetical protein [Candidatus Babeliales bacterium]
MNTQNKFFLIILFFSFTYQAKPVPEKDVLCKAISVGLITASITTLASYIILYNMTPKRRFERAQNSITKYKNYPIINIAKKYSSLDK